MGKAVEVSFLESLWLTFLSRQQRVLLIGTPSIPVKCVLETAATHVTCVPSLKKGQFPDETFDFALIDGIEGYSQLKETSELLYPMMKREGHVAFHNFTDGPGVRQAVRSFVLRYVDLAGRVDRLQVVRV